MMHERPSKKSSYLKAIVLISGLLVSPLHAASITHRFDFEDETGDDSVGGLEGVLMGDPGFSSDAPSGNLAIILEGDQYVRIDDDMDFGTEFSIFMWVQPDSSALGIQNLVANAPGGWDTDGFKLYYNTWSDPSTADGAFLLETGDGADFGLAGQAVRSDPDTIFDDTWYHVGTTVDLENGEALLYVDGELQFATGGLNLDMKTDAPFEIGNMLTGWDLHGLMDDVQIYDGILTDEEVMSLFNEPGSAIGLPTSLPGDFNENGVLDAPDIDDLTGQSAGGMNVLDYDLNDDSLVDSADIDVWIKDLFHSWIGDANLDGEFQSADLVQVLASGTYETGDASVWSTGDFNGDGLTGSSDLVVALADGGYEQGPAAAVAAVPEPGVIVLCAFAMFGLLTARHQRRGSGD